MNVDARWMEVKEARAVELPDALGGGRGLVIGFVPKSLKISGQGKCEIADGKDSNFLTTYVIFTGEDAESLLKVVRDTIDGGDEPLKVVG